MPMQTQTKERIYLLIMVFCLLMCAVLLISVFCDLPIAAVSTSGEVHTPAVRSVELPVRKGGADLNAPASLTEGESGPVSGENGVEITEAYLTAEMSRFIPQSFPATQIEASIASDSIMGFDMTVHKSDLKAYLESIGVSMGVKQTLALSMLPDQLEVEADLECLSTGQSGLELAVAQLSVGGAQVDLDFLPASLFDVLGSAVNAALAWNGYQGSNVVFADGVILLQK